MTWDIVVGLIALIGVFGTIAGWSGKLSKTLANLETTLQALNKTLDELKRNNKESHKEIYGRLAEHETRITRLEEHTDI